MSTFHPTYKLDYSPQQGIVVSGPGNTRHTFSINHPDNDSPLTLFQYDSADDSHLSLRGVTAANFTETQRLIRIWDMIKDGSNSAAMNDGIWNVMAPGQPHRPFDHFKNIRKAIVKLPNISAKIVKSTWIKPNRYEDEHDKLSERFGYQESGLSPHEVIDRVHYVINIANTIIDPFQRALNDVPANRKSFYPGANNSLEITPAFFNFMGFSNCSLQDKQRTNGTSEDSHEYALEIAPNVVVEKHNFPRPPYDHAKGWYAGNATKNANFNNVNDNDKMALLNVKELGDVLQVLLMFMKGVTDGASQMQQTMVTSDSVVFMLCIIFGLDCVYYQHIPRSTALPRGENHVYHFNAKYTLENAKGYFSNIRDAIKEHNLAQINALTAIMNENKTVSISGVTVVPNFHFCKRFLRDIIRDMEKINNVLADLNPENYVDNNADDNTNISQLNNYTFQLKSYYKIKVLFTNKGNSLQFKGTYCRYTEKITPLSLDSSNIVQSDIVILPDQPVSNNINMQLENDEISSQLNVNMPSSESTSTVLSGWNVVGYNHTIPFLSLYTQHYVVDEPSSNADNDCMHPTKVRPPPRVKTLAERQAEQNAWMRELLGEAPNNNGRSRKRRKRFGGANQTRNNKSLPNWHIFDLDLDRKVVYTEKTKNGDIDIDIHREWLDTVNKYLTSFFSTSSTPKGIFYTYKNDFYRDMYEYCDNNNVVIAGTALKPLVYKTMSAIIKRHNTYIKPITIVTSPTKRPPSMMRTGISPGVARPLLLNNSITAGGRAARKRITRRLKKNKKRTHRKRR
jgi:hypothetical protein